MNYTKNFSDRELACRCSECGTMPGKAVQLAAQTLRDGWAKLHPESPGVSCNSGSRCDNYTLYLRMCNVPAALHSAHITGEAMDLAPVNGRHQEFQNYVRSRLVELDLYMEDPIKTVTWAHVQTRKVNTPSRVFLP